jgi:hypothetical protein
MHEFKLPFETASWDQLRTMHLVALTFDYKKVYPVMSIHGTGSRTSIAAAVLPRQA